MGHRKTKDEDEKGDEQFKGRSELSERVEEQEHRGGTPTLLRNIWSWAKHSPLTGPLCSPLGRSGKISGFVRAGNVAMSVHAAANTSDLDASLP